MRKISSTLAHMLEEKQSGSPLLTSGLLSDYVYSEMDNDLFKEEGKALEAELNLLHAGMQSDAKDLETLIGSMSKTIALEELFKKAINDSVNPATVTMLLSEFSSIYKDTLAEEFIYAKNLNNENAFNTLEAGLQSVSSFIDTLKKLIKTVWEAIIKAGKFFWSKIKQFMTWIFGNMRGVSKKQDSNTFSLLTLEAARNVFQEYRNSKEYEDFINGEIGIVSEELAQKMYSTFEKELDGLISKMKIKLSSGADVKSELRNFISGHGEMLSGKAAFINLVMNVSLISKRVHDEFIETIEKNKEIKDSIVTLYLISNSSSKAQIETIGESLREPLLHRGVIENITDVPFRDSIREELFKTAAIKIFDKFTNDEAKWILYSIVYGDHMEYITKDAPKICDKISAVYKDILNIFKAGSPKYEKEKFNISELNLESDSYVLSNIKSTKDLYRYNIEYINFFKKSDMEIEVNVDFKAALNKSGSGNFLPIDILVNQSIDNKSQHEKSNDRTNYFSSLENMGKEFDLAIAEAGKFTKWLSEVTSEDLEMEKDLMNSLSSIVNNLNAINPTTGIQLFQTVNKAYSTIVNKLDVNKMIVDAFNDLNK